MHPIWTAYANGKIDSKEALKQIGEAYKVSKGLKEKQLLLTVSERIMDREVPLSSRDSDAEEVYSARLNKDEE